ncbi:MAG TPA: hypothetical protein VLE72_01960 [Candidatus Saccharimonadales bacterium]|nr:hypothetical protein [Candidatus Saccharimonadales bacterium]
MKHTYQICISGAAAGDSVEVASGFVKDVAKEVIRRGHIVLTGASTGLPHIAALAAQLAGGPSIGFSPAANRVAHIRTYHLPLNGFDTILYTGFGYTGRDLLLVRSGDAMIMVGGRIGTLNELTIAIEEHKPIGVLVGSGGETAEVQHVLKAAKRIRSNIIFGDDPVKLVADVIKVVDKKYAKLRKN